ncbi:MAG: ATP-dependent zinc protease, partial [Sedimenticola sp.]
IELTLTNRDNMKFRALLGRTALKGRFLVDSGVSFRCGGDKQTPPPEDI